MKNGETRVTQLVTHRKSFSQISSEDEIPRIPVVPKSYFYCDKTYIITGGLGGFGLELAEWLVYRGATNFVLTSRSGVKTGYQRRKLFYLREMLNVDVTVSNKNICNMREVRELFESVKGRPVGGVFHLAGVSLVWGQFENMHMHYKDILFHMKKNRNEKI